MHVCLFVANGIYEKRVESRMYLQEVECAKELLEIIGALLALTVIVIG